MASSSLSTWRRHARASLALTPGDTRWVMATKAAATMLLVVGGAQAAGRLSLGILASLGAFTVLYGSGARPGSGSGSCPRSAPCSSPRPRQGRSRRGSSRSRSSRSR